MEFKGTKAPWLQSHRKVDDEGNYSTQVYDEKGETICTLAWCPVKNGNVISTAREDNAKLIAAAPDLLEALQNLTFLHSCEQEGIGNSQPKSSQWFEAVDKAETAIAKALGKNF